MFNRTNRRSLAAAALVTLGLAGISNAALPDMNNNGHIGIDDLQSYMTSYFAGEKAADTNADGVVSVQDLFDFVSRWMEGRVKEAANTTPAPKKEAQLSGRTAEDARTLGK